jgi:Fe2+ transport system protein B
MSETEKLTSASQLAAKLEITLQMLSVYVKAYTKLTKVQIKKVGRKGRHFDALQLQILTNARDIVRTNTGVGVEEAMRRAVVFDSQAVEGMTPSIETGDGTAALVSALRREVAQPIVEELQRLRAEIASLKATQTIEAPRAVEDTQVHSTETKQYSPLKRIIRRWLGL